MSGASETPQAPFGVEMSRGDGEIIMLVQGEIDVASAPVLWERLVEALPDTKRLVLDLRETAFIDSTGLSIFVRALRRLRGDGGELILRSPGPSVRKILDITGLDQVFTIEA
jgi:anti-sigma B factor antagonist